MLTQNDYQISERLSLACNPLLGQTIADLPVNKLVNLSIMSHEYGSATPYITYEQGH